MTTDKGNFNFVEKYGGKERLVVGNGDKLYIAHIGSGKIPALNDKPLKLNKLPHVPSIKRNLISVSQLTNDNNVYMEFYADFCTVKDLQTKEDHVARITLGQIISAAVANPQVRRNPSRVVSLK